MKKLFALLAFLLAPALAEAQSQTFYSPPLGFALGTSGYTVPSPLLLPDGTANAPSLRMTSGGVSYGWFWQAGAGMAYTEGSRALFSPGFGGPTIDYLSSLKWAGATGLASTDVYLWRDAANTLALRNGTSAQQFNVYDTYTSAADYRRIAIYSSAGTQYIQTQSATAGSGYLVIGSQNTLYFQAGTGTPITQASLSTTAFAPSNDDALDFGASATKFKSLFLSRSIQGSKSKALTDATATAFVRVAIPQTIATNYKGGQVIYEIYCDDDTNQASQAGTVKFTCHNLAGTEACGFGTPDGVTLGDGTASLAAPTFDASSASADTIDLRVNSDCTGIAPNTHTIEWRLDMPTTATITPQ
jgi:hypothetical protein